MTGNEVKIRASPAGQTVGLGQFFESQTIEIRGMAIPKACAYIPVSR